MVSIQRLINYYYSLGTQQLHCLTCSNLIHAVDNFIDPVSFKILLKYFNKLNNFKIFTFLTI